jgi:hypothetical protein
MENSENKKPKTVTEEDLENLSGAFNSSGPDTPWSRIMEGTSDSWKQEWRQSMEKSLIPEITEEDLENLSGAFNNTGPDTPWSRIVQHSPVEWKTKWKDKLDNKYGK